MAAKRVERFYQHVRNKSKISRFIFSTSTGSLNSIRAFFAERYIKGEGIEIGAQHSPTQVNRQNAQVRYVDRLVPEVSAEHHGIDQADLVVPSFYLEADDLKGIEDNSLDFVIGNHIIEHTDDPLSTILEWFRVLRDRGVVFLALPNFTSNEYDFERLPLGLDHFVEAHANRKSASRTEHKIEHWKEFVSRVDECEEGSAQFNAILKNYTETDNRIHFHVYDFKLIFDLLNWARRNHRIDFGIVDGLCFQHGFEVILILKKGSSDRFPGWYFTLRNAALLVRVYVSSRFQCLVVKGS